MPPHGHHHGGHHGHHGGGFRGDWFRGGPWIAPQYEYPIERACGFALPNGSLGPYGTGYYRTADGRLHAYGPSCEPLAGMGDTPNYGGVLVALAAIGIAIWVAREDA